jgi:hypothetical protein
LELRWIACHFAFFFLAFALPLAFGTPALRSDAATAWDCGNPAFTISEMFVDMTLLLLPDLSGMMMAPLDRERSIEWDSGHVLRNGRPP